MKKVIVIGCPGSGKTTFSKRLSEKTGLPIFHLDAIWHKPDRTHITREEYDARLYEILMLDSWIIDGNYQRTIEMRRSACDTVFLFDLPLEICLDGAISRLGTDRYDTELDPKLEKEIRNFKDENLPKIYDLIDRYKEGRRVIVFKSGGEVNEFLSEEKR